MLVFIAFSEKYTEYSLSMMRCVSGHMKLLGDCYAYMEFPMKEIIDYPKFLQDVVSKSLTEISDQDPANQPRSKIEPWLSFEDNIMHNICSAIWNFTVEVGA